MPELVTADLMAGPWCGAAEGVTSQARGPGLDVSSAWTLKVLRMMAANGVLRITAPVAV